MGGQGLDGWGQSRNRGSPSPTTGENPGFCSAYIYSLFTSSYFNWHCDFLIASYLFNTIIASSKRSYHNRYQSSNNTNTECPRWISSLCNLYLRGKQTNIFIRGGEIKTLKVGEEKSYNITDNGQSWFIEF